MAGRVECEFSLVRYVPDPVRGEFTNIGVILRDEASGATAVRFTRDWSRVRCLHPDADVEMLESLEAEIAERLQGERQSQAEGIRPLWDVFADSLSQSVQVTERSAALAESLPAQLELLLRMFVEPLRAPARRKKATGRAAIAGNLRDAFERVGVWPLLRKKIAAREYTEPGDPLRLDCGYRNGQVRLFHAVSLEIDAELAKGLAYTLPQLRAGVARVEKLELQLTAVVEPVNEVSDNDLYRFGVGVMEGAGLRVLTVADLGRVAETARQELRL